MKVAKIEIEAQAKKALIAHGAAQWQASEVARAVSRAEEIGNVICGLYYLESYCTQLETGRVDGQIQPELIIHRPGAIGVNAKFGFAQPAFAMGLERAVQAAKDNGIASYAISHSHTCTSLGFFTEQIAAEGLIAIGTTNASAIVSGPGGKNPIIGTNPIAITIPGKDGPRMHADFSTAAVALGKITMAKEAGQPIPLGWAVDADGNETTDPVQALGGSLVSAASYKGWALGLLVEALAAGVTGSVNSLDVKGLKLADGRPHDLGQFYILIDPNSHDGEFDARFERLVTAIAQDEGVRIPGATPKNRDPIEVPDALWAKVLKLAG